MKKTLKIGIVGCGAIGGSLARYISGSPILQSKIVALYDIDMQKARALSDAIRRGSYLVVGGLDELIKRSDVVVEATSMQAAWPIAKKVIGNGKDVLLLSVGGVLAHAKALVRLAQRYKANVFIPSGAVCGIDALKAQTMGNIRKVVLTTRKNPLSFRGVKFVERKKIQLGKMKKDTVLFSGSAYDAVRYFPQNINVAAVLSLAGIGSKRTKVRIIASPRTKSNIHEIVIESDSGRVVTRTENVTHPSNPKTSFLAVLSALASVKNIVSVVKVGS
jgi:aspartate dehydrogenase